MRKAKDLIGQTFGRLTVLEKADYYVEPCGTRRLRYICKCVCGNVVTVRCDYLTRGRTKSCGCLKRDYATKLGLSNANRKSNRKSNRYEFDGNVGKCYLSNDSDRYFIFDTEDYDKIKDYTWYRVDNRVEAYYCASESRVYKAYVSRVVMPCPEDLVVRHKNKDLFDNRKCNLEICSRAQLARFNQTPKNNKTGYKGIQKSRQLNDGSYHYKALIYVNGRTKYIGTYKTFEEACAARLEAEKKYYADCTANQDEKGE